MHQQLYGRFDPRAADVAARGDAAFAGGQHGGGQVVGLVLPLIYLVTAALGRPASTWAVFGVLGVVFGLLAAQDAIPTTAVLSAVAVLAVP